MNSLYHRDYSLHEPVEISIEPDGIDILNCSGPDHSIPMAAIEKGDYLKSRRYRNRRLGDFLKELELTEGRSTGVPTIQEKLANNGSPRATFETTEDRLSILIHIPVHEGCGNVVVMKDTIKDTINDTINITGTESKILDLIRKDNNVTRILLCTKTGLSDSTIARNLKSLQEKGLVERKGSRKTGHWEILKF